eukprot:gene3048-1315_t
MYAESGPRRPSMQYRRRFNCAVVSRGHVSPPVASHPARHRPTCNTSFCYRRRRRFVCAGDCPGRALHATARPAALAAGRACRRLKRVRMGTSKQRPQFLRRIPPLPGFPIGEAANPGPPRVKPVAECTPDTRAARRRAGGRASASAAVPAKSRAADAPAKRRRPPPAAGAAAAAAGLVGRRMEGGRANCAAAGIPPGAPPSHRARRRAAARARSSLAAS